MVSDPFVPGMELDFLHEKMGKFGFVFRTSVVVTVSQNNQFQITSMPKRCMWAYHSLATCSHNLGSYVLGPLSLSKVLGVLPGPHGHLNFGLLALLLSCQLQHGMNGGERGSQDWRRVACGRLIKVFQNVL